MKGLSLSERIASARSLSDAVPLGVVSVDASFVGQLADDLLTATPEELAIARADNAHLIPTANAPVVAPASLRDERRERAEPNICDEEGG